MLYLNRFITVLLVIIIGFSYLSRWSRFAEYVVSFRPQICLFVAIALALTIFSKQKPLTWLLATLLVVNGWGVAPYIALPSPLPHTSDLSLYFLNVNRHNLPYVGIGGLTASIESQNPDVVVLAEMGEEQADQLRDVLGAEYAFSHAHYAARVDGTVILSRIPLENSAVLELGEGRKTVTTDLMTPNGFIHLVSAHPTNAIISFEERNSQLETLAQYVQSGSQPLVLVGDLNVTMWSYWYKGFERGGLENMRAGRGVMASWGRPRPFVKLPLDHVMVGNGVEVISAELLPLTTSDHAPILVTLSLP